MVVSPSLPPSMLENIEQPHSPSLPPSLFNRKILYMFLMVIYFVVMCEERMLVRVGEREGREVGHISAHTHRPKEGKEMTE